MLAGGSDGSVRFFDLGTGAVTPGSGRHNSGVERAAFSPTGARRSPPARTAACSSGTSAGERGRDTRRPRGEDHRAGDHPGSPTLYTSGLDGKVIVWDLAGDRRLGRSFTAGMDDPEFPRYALSPDGRDLAVGQLDGTVA